MQLAIVGFPSAGVKTIFSAITGLTESAGVATGGGGQGRVAMLKVPDDRLELISDVYNPKKKTPATVEIAEYPGLFGQKTDPRSLSKAREADALVLVLRAFESMMVPHLKGSIDPGRDLDDLVPEMVLADLAIAEPRVQRLKAGLQKRKDDDEAAELAVLERCVAHLESGERLQDLPLDPNDRKRLKGFGFLSLKPIILLVNAGDAQIGCALDEWPAIAKSGFPARVLCGDIEAELSAMEPAERAEFMTDLGVEALAAPVVLAAAYQTLEVVTFFTYGEDECRAWTIRSGETAVDAAGKIHTDLARGFIRAEVVSFADFEEHGDIKAARSAGRFRLEGKDYPVLDGDLLVIRHSG